jgi:hypothetical protein
VIWRRTIVLLFLAIAVSVPLIVEVRRESRPCSEWKRSEVPSEVRSISFDEAQVGFNPCQINVELGFWPRILVLSWFALWVAFIGSFVRDVFLYWRGRRLCLTVQTFRWLR